MLCALACALAGAQNPPTLSEAKLRIVRDMSVELRPAPSPTSRRALPSTPARFPAQSTRISVDPTDLVPRDSRSKASISSGVIRQVADIRQLTDDPILIPVQTEPMNDDISLQGDRGLVTLIATGADLRSVLRMIADHHGLNLVLGPDVAGPVTVSIRGAHLEEVLDAILGVAGFSWHRVDNLLYVTGAAASGMDPRVQGLTLQVYPLDYVAAIDVEAVATRLLSPAGNAFVTESDSGDQMKTRELLVVEDTIAGHQRIAQYIAQIDIPPRQVLIEAHVLQISLDEQERHGINWRGIAHLGKGGIEIEGKNFADDPGNDPALIVRVNGSDMDGLIELIREQTNSRTLASPKLSVVNRQEAKIQIGQRLPYSVSTTTQTTTVQSVEFLDVGIVLTVEPVITEDGNVLMTVFPKVSGGKITENGFPEEDTTEVQTTVLLPDGGGVIIGGLIREDNVQARAIVPGLGAIPILGRLFRKRADTARRNELVVALVTHVMHDHCGMRQHELLELEQTVPPYAANELLSPQLPLMLGH